MPFLLLFALCLGSSPYLAPDSVQTRLLHPESYADMIDRKGLDSHIRFLSDSSLQGRETGTAGGSAATIYIAGKFLEYGLVPLGTGNPQHHNTTFIQGFACPAGQRGRNVIGWLPAGKQSDEYIVVSAHYDHLGMIGGNFYPGADSNASGVSSLLSLVQVFSILQKEGYRAERNIIFVAYDAKEFSMTGARIFALSLGIPANQIILNMNLDLLGTSLEPPGAALDYLLILGAGTVSSDIVRSLNNNNSFFNLGLDLDYSFYNSPGFADIFFTMTEQSILAQMGVPSLLITSGLNDHTYKPSDTPQIIDLPVLEKRVRWLFFTLWDLAYR